jgi:hypothetical protein
VRRGELTGGRVFKRLRVVDAVRGVGFGDGSAIAAHDCADDGSAGVSGGGDGACDAALLVDAEKVAECVDAPVLRGPVSNSPLLEFGVATATYFVMVKVPFIVAQPP